jgi:cell division protein FtsB
MWAKIKNSIPLNILLLAAALWIGYSAYSLVGEALALRKEARDSQAKIKQLAHKKAELEAYIAELESRGAVEREAKARLNLKLSGEEVVVVLPEEISPGAEIQGSVWKKLQMFFRRLFNR